MCTTRAKVRISGGDAVGIRNQQFFFSGEPTSALEKAVNFAQGFAFACCEGRYGLDLQTPCVPSIDGYMWWMRGGNFRIEVLNMKDEPVRREEDL